MNPIILNLTRRILIRALGQPPQEDLAAQTAQRTYQRLLKMPRFLVFPLICLTIIFNWYGILLVGRRFCRQTPEQQDQQIQHWQKSALGPFRDFLKLYQKTIIFIYYSLPPVILSLNGDAE